MLLHSSFQLTKDFGSYWRTSKYSFLENENGLSKERKRNCLLDFHSNTYRIFGKIWFYYMVLLSAMNTVWHHEFFDILLGSDSSWQYKQQSVWCADEGTSVQCQSVQTIQLLIVIKLVFICCISEPSAESCSL